VLPIVFGNHFVGRIEPRIDRDGDRVEVLGLWWEQGFGPRRTEGFVEAMHVALQAYLRLGDVSNLDWAPHLAADRRTFIAAA